VRLLHDPVKISASFDDPNLVSRAGLVPLMSLAERAGLHALVRGHVQITAKTGVYPEVKVACLVAGMAAGADSIDDMGLLRHGAMPDLFAGVRAPSTLGSFLRSFTWGNVRQLEAAGRELLGGLARAAPLLPGADQLAFVDFDSMQRRVYGHAKQGAAFGHTKISGKTVLVRGLNTLAATICTPQAAPIIAATRLRGGSANTARGAASFTTSAVSTARTAGCTGTIVARADSGLYCAAFTGACRRAGAYFSVTARMDPAVTAAIAPIPDGAWTPIRYPRAIWDDQLRAWVSDAGIAEIGYTAFTSRKGQAITARLIVRRVRDRNRPAGDGQGELFRAWRYHPVFTDSPFVLLQAEEHHRDYLP
jgi:Transposase DDE domain group 1